MEHIDNYCKYTKEEVEFEKKNKASSKNEVGSIKNSFCLETMNDSYKLGIQGNYTNKDYRMLPVKFQMIGVDCEVPRPYLNNKLIMRAFWQCYDDYSNKAYNPDLPVGGILNIELFNFPEIPKTHGKWTMRDIFSMEKNLEKLHFPDLSIPNPVLSTVEVKY